MSEIIVNILCEGQTEEKFVKDVLKPYLRDRSIIIKHRLLNTSQKKNAKGGLVNYLKAKRDLEIWMKEVGQNAYERHYFTTMFDLYALPNDFPGYAEAEKVTDAYQRVQKIEEGFGKDISSESFIPYIQLHEFEALLFCDVEKLEIDYPRCKKSIEQLKSVLTQYNDNPELIDNSPQTAPSKRIIRAIEGENKYNYNKPKSGTSVTKAIGMDDLMRKCTHFKDWVIKLESLVKVAD